MGMISPPRPNSSRFYTCSCLAGLGCLFWVIMACCVGLLVLVIGEEIANGNALAAGDYNTFVTLDVGAVAFLLSMVSLMLVFAGYGFYLQKRRAKPLREPVRRRVVLTFAGLYVGGMILAAAIPGYALSAFDIPAWLKILSPIFGFLYFIFGTLMLWLSVQEYEHLAIHEN